MVNKRGQEAIKRLLKNRKVWQRRADLLEAALTGKKIGELRVMFGLERDSEVRSEVNEIKNVLIELYPTRDYADALPLLRATYLNTEGV